MRGFARTLRLSQISRLIHNVILSEVVAHWLKKNESTEVCMNALRDISMLNNDVMQLPILMGSLQTDLRAKTSFSHIQRLHNMPYAYGATIIEIVRRKEFGLCCFRISPLQSLITTYFSKFLLSSSTKHPGSDGETQVYDALDFICVQLTFGDSASEKKRRQIYRGEVHGQLPFDPKIPEEPVPSIKDFSTTGGKYTEYSIERKDIEGS